MRNVPYFFFQGEFASAAHLLVRQLKAILRQILKAQLDIERHHRHAPRAREAVPDETIQHWPIACGEFLQHDKLRPARLRQFASGRNYSYSTARGNMHPFSEHC
jgi:hypothetical protein